jgi:hypothetical protein
LLPRRPTRRSSGPLGPYQRLLINPLLVVLGWLIAVAVLRFSLQARDPTVFATAVCLLLLSMLLVQFHCLDCGATGWLLLRRRHACPAVVGRRQDQAIRRIHSPGIRTQVVIWLLILIVGTVLAAHLLRGL